MYRKCKGSCVVLCCNCGRGCMCERCFTRYCVFRLSCERSIASVFIVRAISQDRQAVLTFIVAVKLHTCKQLSCSRVTNMKIIFFLVYKSYLGEQKRDVHPFQWTLYKKLPRQLTCSVYQPERGDRCIVTMLIDAQQLVHCSCFLAFLFILFNPQKQQQHANWPVNTILKLSVMATLFCASVHCGKAMLALYYRVNYWVMLLTEKEPSHLYCSLSCLMTSCEK